MQVLNKPSVESVHGTDPAEESLLFGRGYSLQTYFAPVPFCLLNAGVGGVSVWASIATENLIREPHLRQLKLGSLRASRVSTVVSMEIPWA